VLDAIAPLSPETRSMFGCLAVYVQDKIVLILRDKRDATADIGEEMLSQHAAVRCGNSTLSARRMEIGPIEPVPRL
jgi:hypothetical protein